MPDNTSFAALNDAFSAALPTAALWVDVYAGTATGDGSAERPFDTIQSAIVRALPGTAIMVRAGTYNENVVIPRTVSGSDTAPIWLVSADGPQQAHIVAPDARIAAIGGGGTENFIVDGFHVSGGKNGIQFSQNGYDWTDMIRNIVIRNNVIDGELQDGMKLNGGEHVVVANNMIYGGHDESIDLFGIVHGDIVANDVSGNRGKSATIFAKGGSQDIRILSNYIHDGTANGISVGGWSDPDILLRPGYSTFQARDVIVDGNRVENIWKRAISFYGAQDSVATHNYLQAVEKYYTVVHVGSSNVLAGGAIPSTGIIITDNQITRSTKTLYIEDGSGDVTFARNNDATVTASVAGSHIENDIAPLLAAVTPNLMDYDWPLSAAYTNIAKTGSGTADGDLITDTGGELAGHRGDDTYITTGGTMRIVEKADEGIDTVLGKGRYLALPDNVENLLLQSKGGSALIGSDGDNIIQGARGNDYIAGNGGSDRLTGGGGADTFLLDAAAPLQRITDFAHGDVALIAGNPFATFADLRAALQQVGNDAVLQFADGQRLILDGVSVDSLVGADFGYGANQAARAVNAAKHVVALDKTSHVAKGGTGADLISGTGDGLLVGGAGNDTYVLEAGGDHVIERADGGTDMILLFTDAYTMEANVENVTVRSSAGSSVIGNNLANVIVGGIGADTLRGGVGADVLTGGDSADRFVFAPSDGGGDVITDYHSGVDRLDLHALKVATPSLRLTTLDGAQGLAIYADHNGMHDLIVTLAGVHAIAPSDLLL